MSKDVIAAFQRAANDENKPIMIVIDTDDVDFAFQLASRLQGDMNSPALGAAIVDMTPPRSTAPQEANAKVLKYTREISHAAAIQQPIIAIVNLDGEEEKARHIAISGLSLGIDYEVRAYHITRATADTEDPPAITASGLENSGIAAMSWIQIGGATTPASTAALIVSADVKPGKLGHKTTARKKTGKSPMGK